MSNHQKSFHSPRELVVKSIRGWIRSGKLSPGMMMPGEDEISRKLSVARGTARTALEMLEEEGVLLKRNRRRYVADQEPLPIDFPLMRKSILVFGSYGDNAMEYKDTGFLQAVQAGVFERTAELGMHVVNINVETVSDSELESMLRFRPAGVTVLQKVLYTERGGRIVELARAAGVPLVLDYEDERFLDCCRVLPDHESANYELTRQMIGRGFRRILCFYPDHADEYWFNDRHRGYRRAMEEAGLTPMSYPKRRALQPEYEFTRECFEDAARVAAGFLVEFLNAPEAPDLIMAGSDWEVPIIGAALELFGKKPNRDIYLAGYDNRCDTNPWLPYGTTLPVASVEKHNTAIGRRLVDRLLELAEGKREPLRDLVKSDLILFD